MAPLLRVEDLRVEYRGAARAVRAVDGVSFALRRGETYALVGESGCGKTATALALLRLVEPGRITGGRIVFEERDLVQASEREMRRVRGARIGIVFQEPAAALNPVMRVGWQVAEAPRIHRGLGRREAWNEAVRLLQTVALPDPARQARAYPHELSGGMMQRVMIAIALSCSPALLVADEPTAALDVTIQAQILGLLRRLRQELRLTVLLITHDLGVVAENADRVGVMYAGRLVEEAPVSELFAAPHHPYTRGLLRAVPGWDGPRSGRRLPTLPGAVPDAADPPPGCRFHPRCPERFDPCARVEPTDQRPQPDRRVACLLHDPRHATRASTHPPGRERA
jgi:peptide/nickel transport system ATP-binding protein/oligopeptide transport system ATP-binding protein